MISIGVRRRRGRRIGRRSGRQARMTTTQERSDAGGRTRQRVIPTTPVGERSLGELVATLSRDLALLVHQEIELAKADLKLGVIKAGAGAAGLIVALVALLLGAPILSIACALGIHALGISLGWSFFIIWGVWTLIAIVAAGAGLFALRKIKQHKRAVDSVKADMQAIARKPSPVPPHATTLASARRPTM
jgi:hypothetical protein